MINPELIKYISEESAKGVSEENVKSALIQNNWSKQDIDEAFAVLKNKSGHLHKNSKVYLIAGVSITLLLIGIIVAYFFVRDSRLNQFPEENDLLAQQSSTMDQAISNISDFQFRDSKFVSPEEEDQYLNAFSFELDIEENLFDRISSIDTDEDAKKWGYFASVLEGLEDVVTINQESTAIGYHPDDIALFKSLLNRATERPYFIEPDFWPKFTHEERKEYNRELFEIIDQAISDYQTGARDIVVDKIGYILSLLKKRMSEDKIRNLEMQGGTARESLRILEGVLTAEEKIQYEEYSKINTTKTIDNLVNQLKAAGMTDEDIDNLIPVYIETRGELVELLKDELRKRGREPIF